MKKWLGNIRTIIAQECQKTFSFVETEEHFFLVQLKEKLVPERCDSEVSRDRWEQNSRLNFMTSVQRKLIRKKNVMLMT